MTFPKEYRTACHYLVRFGSSSGDARIGRLKIAAALLALRAIEPNWAKVYRRDMLRIAYFPLNPNVAIRNHAVRQW